MPLFSFQLGSTVLLLAPNRNCLGQLKFTELAEEFRMARAVTGAQTSLRSIACGPGTKQRDLHVRILRLQSTNI